MFFFTHEDRMTQMQEYHPLNIFKGEKMYACDGFVYENVCGPNACMVSTEAKRGHKSSWLRIAM